MIVVGGIDREEWSPQQSLVFSLKCSDLNQLTWEPVEIMPSGRTPLPRIGHSLTVLNKDSLVMYGGRSTNRENGTVRKTAEICLMSAHINSVDIV